MASTTKPTTPSYKQWKGTVPPDPGNPLEWPYPFWPKEEPREAAPVEFDPEKARKGYTGRLDGDHLDESEVDEFLNGQMAIIADSTNVFSFRYRPRERALEVTFLDSHNKTTPGATYLYSDISRDEANRMAGAYSKGKFVWNFLRKEGKPYMRIS